jgi:hypothetical protein
LQLQQWLVESDVAADPQAFIISPASAIQLARVVVDSDSHYHAGLAVARKALELLRAAHVAGEVRIAPNEVIWFETLQEALDELPENEAAFIEAQLALADPARFLPGEYSL